MLPQGNIKCCHMATLEQIGVDDAKRTAPVHLSALLAWMPGKEWINKFPDNVFKFLLLLNRIQREMRKLRLIAPISNKTLTKNIFAWFIFHTIVMHYVRLLNWNWWNTHRIKHAPGPYQFCFLRTILAYLLNTNKFQRWTKNDNVFSLSPSFYCIYIVK